MLRTVGKSRLQTAFLNSVKAIEAQNYETWATESRTPTMAIAAWRPPQERPRLPVWQHS